MRVKPPWLKIQDQDRRFCVLYRLRVWGDARGNPCSLFAFFGVSILCVFFVPERGSNSILLWPRFRQGADFHAVVFVERCHLKDYQARPAELPVEGLA